MDRKIHLLAFNKYFFDKIYKNSELVYVLKY